MNGGFDFQPTKGLSLQQRLRAALEKLCKWRSVFAAWQLGTRLIDDPECQAVRDHREATMLLRAEVNALVILLKQKRVFTETEWHQQLLFEVQMLDGQYEKKFPGMSTTKDGVTYNPRALETMKGWKP